MFIHFAFGSLGKQGKTEEQTKQVVDLILREKRLLVSKCKEFIPAYPKKGSKRIPTKMFKVTGEGEASVTFYPKEDPHWFDKLPDNTSIHYLPINIPMICFTKISFNQLNNSAHSSEYGKFGLAFSDDFLKKEGMRQVFYYTETSLWDDELIRKWNYHENEMSKADKTNLEKEIVSYRKPATLFPTFKESVIMKLTSQSEGTTIEYLTYDRYPENYNFEKENEYRIVFDEGVDYLLFEESNLFMIIVPDVKSKEEVKVFLKKNWTSQPIVKIYPS